MTGEQQDSTLSVRADVLVDFSRISKDEFDPSKKVTDRRRT